MNYFDIFRIQFDDLKIIADHPELISTRVIKSDAGYTGEIFVSGEHPDRHNTVLFFHEDAFQTDEEAFHDLNQIISTISIASASTRKSESLNK